MSERELWVVESSYNRHRWSRWFVSQFATESGCHHIVRRLKKNYDAHYRFRVMRYVPEVSA
ncbi:MAG: hypothetical protein GY820_39340 [Gammaproteobacteria bacterium]|nr:hypothetical protein [Gammaproteobacteria bacterium]